MAFELDHLFILTDVGAPAAQALIDFGLAEGKPNTHPGQGTANRRFFFQNMMLELLWVHSEAEARSPLTQPLHLWERWHGRTGPASPFGICLRPTDGKPAALPFPGWHYHPQYLPETLSIWMGENAKNLLEPFVFYLDFAKPQTTPAPAHARGFKQVTALRLFSPHQPTSETVIKGLKPIHNLELLSGEHSLMELGFDHEVQGQEITFMPLLPLRFRW